MSVTQVAPAVSETGMDQPCINTIRTLSIDAVQEPDRVVAKALLGRSEGYQ